MSETFKSIFNLKLIYIFEIRDNAHKGLLKIGDATIETQTELEALKPNCAELNKAAKKELMNIQGLQLLNMNYYTQS